jgi:ice-binding like protein/exosortase sorting signal-containing protein
LNSFPNYAYCILRWDLVVISPLKARRSVSMLRQSVRLLSGVGFAVLLCGVAAVWAQSTLGTAQSFAVLGGSTVTNTGPSVLTGDLGVSPGTAITGFPPGTVTGTIHSADAVALQAQNDVTTQYNALASAACSADLTGQDLGGQTLTPGVYCFSTSAQLTGTLTLNAQGNANATFIFKIGSTLTTASGSVVSLINGGNPCGVAWQIGTSATLGTTTSFMGNLIALSSITLNTGANIVGRALARNGAVTLDTNNISFAPCGATAPPVPPPPPVPTLATWAIIALVGLLGLAGFATLRRRQSLSGQHPGRPTSLP